jgi:hypothetical protein
MKIVSRPNHAEIDEMFGVGAGPNLLRLTDDQLQLMLALVYSCRLGSNTKYSDAAFDIITMIDRELGDDTMSEAFETVMPGVTIEDDLGALIFEAGPSHTINIEV